MPARIADKMRIHAGERLYFANSPADAVAAIDLPAVHIAKRLAGTFDHIILFTKTQRQMDARFPRLKRYLEANGKLWVAWPKGGRLGTDLDLKHVIRIGYNHGLVESTQLRLDDTWTALKFTKPKPNKTYNNSYGKLKISSFGR
jgi:hypothetical protein